MSISNDLDKLHLAVEKYENLMEENILGVKLGCYAVAFTGLAIAVRRVRPFSRFENPSDIPKRFIKERRELLGTVDRIDPNGAILMVRHKPLISLFDSSKATLPVKVSGINITGLGVNWLQAIVVGNEIKFIPVLKEANCVKCEVKLDQQTYNKKLRTINVGESLLNVGFGSLATLEKPLVNDFEYSLYYNRLKAAEAHATRKKMGYKYYVKPAQNTLNNAANRLVKVVIDFTKPQTDKLLKAATDLAKPSKKVPKGLAIH